MPKISLKVQNTVWIEWKNTYSISNVVLLPLLSEAWAGSVSATGLQVFAE